MPRTASVTPADSENHNNQQLSVDLVEFIFEGYVRITDYEGNKMRILEFVRSE